MLAVVNFNMIFSFVVVGWEGSAHDARVLQESNTKVKQYLLLTSQL